MGSVGGLDVVDGGLVGVRSSNTGIGVVSCRVGNHWFVVGDGVVVHAVVVTI